MSTLTTAEETETPKGWHELVNAMLTNTKGMWPEVDFMQVKEKFGSLRVHFESPEEIYGAVSDYIETYEQASRHTCVECGSVHTTRMSSRKGWVSPYCAEHTPRGE